MSLAAGEHGRILVIDDEESIHRSLERILGREGHDVQAVLTAATGLERLTQERYDLVMTDLMMPGMDGIQLLGRIRELGIDVPVMMITGFPSMRTAVQALQLGAEDYLAKPFTRQEVLGPVRRILRGAAEQPDEERPAHAQAGCGGGLEPGARYHLRKHAWLVCEGTGTARVGIEASFLEGAGTIVELALPDEAEQVEQGFTGIRLKTEGGGEHGVFMPLSGQVIAVNAAAVARPDSIDAETWLMRIAPTNVDAELALLLPDCEGDDE